VLSALAIALTRLLALLPLPWLRAVGSVLGALLWVLAAPRRRVVDTNLRLCFPHWSVRERRRQTLACFVYFAQAWLDRGWLWHGRPETVLRRLCITGAVDELAGDAPTVVFAPHFIGLDAGWTALNQQLGRGLTTIYTRQANPVVDDWIRQGRQRFGRCHLVAQLDGARPVIARLKAGEPLYLLPDMNFDPKDSLFVPFFGQLAATVPSLSRFARLARAKIVPVLTRMTPKGYEVEILPSWSDVPSGDLWADTVLMNRRLEAYIRAVPAQYYWVHKRFKDQPPGVEPPY